MFDITTPYRDLSLPHQRALLQALRDDLSRLSEASETLKNDRDFMLAAVRQDWRALRFVSATLRDDPDVVLAAVRKNGGTLECASARLRNDGGIILAAVQQNEWAPEYACEHIKWLLRFASEALCNDRDFILALIRETGMKLQHATDEMQLQHAEAEIPDAFYVSREQYNSVFKLLVSDALKNDKDFILTAVRQNWQALEYASYALQGDQEIVLVAVTQNRRALRFASATLPNAPDIQAIAQMYGETSHFLEFSDEKSATYEYFTSEDPLYILCNIENVHVGGKEDRYKIQLDILKKVYANKWLIPILAQRVATIANKHPTSRDNINRMFPGYDELTDPKFLDRILFPHVYSLIQRINEYIHRSKDGKVKGALVGALIDADKMHAMFGLPEGASEEDLLNAVLTKDYDDLEGIIASPTGTLSLMGGQPAQSHTAGSTSQRRDPLAAAEEEPRLMLCATI